MDESPNYYFTIFSLLMQDITTDIYSYAVDLALAFLW